MIEKVTTALYTVRVCSLLLLTNSIKINSPHPILERDMLTYNFWTRAVATTSKKVSDTVEK
jgi:hypothetical protein